MKRNPRLVYGRMTGWGQTGPLSETAGHDIDYISIAGALESIGRAGQPPLPPLNLVGDFGGGGMLLAFGMVAAILSAQKTGEGQVVDAAMVDGAAALMTMIYTFRSMGIWQDVRGTNLLDTGAPFYEVYETSDGNFMSVGAIEPQFYDKSQWPKMKQRFATLFLTKTRDEWQAIFDGTDACVSPVLSIPEASKHPHNQHRGTFTEVAGVTQPAPAPRFEGTPSAIRRPPPNPGQYGDEALTDWGIDSEEIAKMRSAGAIT
jgi:alpha-methylacyl-CoA racemase